MKLFDPNLAVHPETRDLDISVLIWAWRNKLFENYQAFEKVRCEKCNWLLGFIFPDWEVSDLQLTMRFFLTKRLFLEYFIDKPEVEFIRTIKAVQQNDILGLTGTIRNVCETLIQLSKVCCLHFPLSNWEKNWNDYLEGLVQAEEEFLSPDGPFLDWDEYEYNRITVIGVWLILGMIRHPYQSSYRESFRLEQAIGKMIQFAEDNESPEVACYQQTRVPLKYEMIIDYYPGKEALNRFDDSEYLAYLGSDVSAIGVELIKDHPELENWVYDSFQVMSGWFNWKFFKSGYSSLFGI